MTCREGNWRQGVGTRLDCEAQKVWFILESLPEMPIEALNAAADDFISCLADMIPGAVITSKLIHA